MLRMLGETISSLDQRAQALAAAMPASARASVTATRAAVGGGSFPGVTLESRGVALSPDGPPAAALAAKLRGAAVPVIAVVNAGRVVLDLRAMLPGDDAVAAGAVREALA